MLRVELERQPATKDGSLDLLRYRELRAIRSEQETKFRELCTKCLQPESTCFCEIVKPFDPNMKFVILLHPIERKRRIATGRMTHLCLENSTLIEGEDFTDSNQVNRILSDRTSESVVLYPGASSVDLTPLSLERRSSLFSREKQLTIFVIDGTWHTARKMLRKSENLGALPRICFTAPRPSNFRVRKQPAPGCFSTIEAVHHTIELMGPARGFDLAPGRHENLLEVFDHMVERQLEYVRATRLKNPSKMSRHLRAQEARRLGPANLEKRL
jgi:DTW domain-containing protein